MTLTMLNRVKKLDKLIKSCERLRDDLLIRADTSESDGTRVVNVSNSVWRDFCDSLDEAKTKGVF